MITRMGMLSIQVCVPKEWTDKEAIEFGEKGYPCGAVSGWTIRKKDKYIKNYKARVECSDNKDYVHIVLDA